MSLALDDLPRDPDWLLQQLQQAAEVAATERSRNIALEIERDTAMAERDAVRTERDLIREERDAAQAEIEKLRLLIRQLQRNRFGRRSERLDPDQLQLGLEDLEQTVAAAEAAQEEAATRSGTPRGPRGRRRQLGAPPAHLPRGEGPGDVEDKSCPCCGGAMHVIGEDREEMLDIVPAVLRVRVVRRPRYGCRACEGAVAQAPAPERPVTGGMATEALLAHVLVAKYGDFLPLYRQAAIFARQGIALDRSTLCDWVGRACWWLEPLWRLVRRHVMSSTRIFADDTTLPVLDPGRGRTKTGRLWGYAIDDRPWGGSTPPAVVYLYAADRKGEHPAAHLAGFRGILQVDGYSGFKRLLEDRPAGEIRLAFCWAHCRRRFYEIHQATGSPLAEEALRRIGELYRIEAEIRGRPAEERRATRRERSRPLVEALHAWLTAQLGRVSGKSGLAEAIRYALRHWQGLVLFLDDGRLELDTNTIERAIRPIATRRSLCPPPSSACEHWKLVFGIGSTRTGCSSDRGGHSFIAQVGGPDLVRSARHDLLGGKDAVLDEPADAMVRDAEQSRGFRHREPLAVLLGGAVGTDPVHSAQRADAVRGPRLALTGGHAHPVQRGGDVLVRPSRGHAPYHSKSLFRGAAAMLARLRLADPQLRVLAASPMDRQDDLAHRLVDIGNNVGDQGRRSRWRMRIVTPGAFHAVSRSSARLVKSGGTTAGSGLFTASSRAWQVSTRRSAASQLFSSCAAIRRLSGSQAA